MPRYMNHFRSPENFMIGNVFVFAFLDKFSHPSLSGNDHVPGVPGELVAPGVVVGFRCDQPAGEGLEGPDRRAARGPGGVRHVGACELAGRRRTARGRAARAGGLRLPRARTRDHPAAAGRRRRHPCPPGGCRGA